MLTLLVALVLCGSCLDEAMARPWRGRRGGCAGGVCSVATVTTSTATECKDGVCLAVSGVKIVREGHYYDLALARARACADRMAVGHFLGCPAGCFEGAGMGMSEEQAIRNCCFWGQRPVRAVATVCRGDRWFACTLYE